MGALARWCEDRTMSAPAPSPRETAAEPHVQRYLTVLEAERNLSRFTLRNYASDLRHYFAWLGERGIAMPAITRTSFRSYLATMQENGVARASVARRVSTIKSFYRWLRLTNVMADDPLALVRGPRPERRLPRVLTLEDITGMIAAADGDRPADLRDRALLEVLYACGLRVSEAAGLNAGDVDLEGRSMIVRGKGSRERLVVMGEPARAALERYLLRGRSTLLKAVRTANEAETRGAKSEAGTGRSNARPNGGNVTLFVNRLGTRLSQRRIQLLVRKYALAAGLDERIYPHLLRHTFATHLLDGGAELRVVQELMGHSNPNTTQIYLHVTEERQRSVVEGSLDGLSEVEIARRALARGRKRV